MENRKTVRLSDEQMNKADFLKKLFNCSENTIFIIALEKLYKEYSK